MAPALRGCGGATLARMRTAVVRVGVDLSGELTADQLATGMTTLTQLANEADAEVIDTDLAALPPSRREVEVLLAADDRDAALAAAMQLCTKAFSPVGATVVSGVVTFVSRGTDDDAHGVLAGFGLTGEIVRLPGGDGWDIIEVTLRKADLTRVPESRIHTALEASLNSEVRILTV
jgi:hypothetical protein